MYLIYTDINDLIRKLPDRVVVDPTMEKFEHLTKNIRKEKPPSIQLFALRK